MTLPDLNRTLRFSRVLRARPPRRRHQFCLWFEVSDTTFNYDRGEKASLYAANGIADYWIINLAARQILVHRQPVKDVSQPRGWRYESIALLQPADRLAPLAKMGETINMSEVLR